MPEWKVKRGEEEFVAKELEQLQTWAKHRRVLPNDYVFHPLLERWMYAREVAELSDHLQAHASVPPVPAPQALANMKKCPDCGNDVSAGAGACPKCGRRFTSAPTKLVFGCIVLVALFVFILGAATVCNG